MPTEALVPDVRNARKHPKGQLVKLQAFADGALPAHLTVKRLTAPDAICSNCSLTPRFEPKQRDVRGFARRSKASHY